MLKLRFRNIRTVIVFVTMFVLSMADSYGQQIVRSVIGAQGTSSNTYGLKIQSSVGQPSLISNDKSKKYGLRQGFNQPIYASFPFSETSFSVFPNPTENEINISFKLIDERATEILIRVLDLQGRVLLSTELSSNQKLITFSIEDYNSGTYLIELSDGLSISTEKIIKL